MVQWDLSDRLSLLNSFVDQFLMCLPLEPIFAIITLTPFHLNKNKKTATVCEIGPYHLQFKQNNTKTKIKTEEKKSRTTKL